MTLTQLVPPYPIFTDKSGSPLDNGYLYFGTANLNPETNPITVYYDRGFTQPVAQPVRTSAGYVMRNGSPAAIYANGEFSVTVRDKKKALVIYSPVGFGVVPGIPFATFDNAAKDVAALLANATFTYSAGVPNTVQVAAGDILRTLAEGFAYTVAASSATDQHVTTAGGVKLYVQPGETSYNVKAFGAKGDGSTNDTAAIQKALDCIPNGPSSYAPSKLTGGAGRLRLIFPEGNYIVTSVLDCSQRDYVEIDTNGRATIYSASTTYILDMASTDHCIVRNLVLYSTTARVGIYLDRCTSAPFVQYNTFENVAITLTTNTAANAGIGRIGIWNGRGELNHFRNVEIRADLPLYSTNTADAAFSPSSGTLQTLFVTSAVNTFIGCLFIGHTAYAPCMLMRGSVSHEFIDGYWAQANTAIGSNPYAAKVYGISSCKFTGSVENLPSFMLVEGAISYFNFIDIAFQNNLDGRGIIQMQDVANNVGMCASTIRVAVVGVIPAGSAAVKVTATALNALISGNNISNISNLPAISAGSNANVKGNILQSDAGTAVLATSVISNEITSQSSKILSAVASGVATKILTTVPFTSYLVTAYLYNNGAPFIATATVINDGTNVVILNYATGAFIALTALGADLRVTQTSGGPNDIVCRVLAI